MIGTFWNLCRACPSMPIDKLHSEYQSTYRWYEYKGPVQEVINRPPKPVVNGSGAPAMEKTMKVEVKDQNTVTDGTPGNKGTEPALPRRRKNPDLAYKTNKFISIMSEERDKVPNEIPAVAERARKLEQTNGPASAAFRNAVAKISTEYRLQFAWPRDGEEHLTNGKPAGNVIPEPGLGPPRKSISMGTIKPNQSNIVPVHRKRNTEADRHEGQSEAEPLVAETKNEDLREYKTEYKKKFRPFSHYDYIGGRFLQKEVAIENKNEVSIPADSTWYKEVLELRKKADEYKHRGWGVELLADAEAYNKHLALWEQVLCRSSLSALSLASTTPRPGVKEEKDTKKVWPTRAAWSRLSTPRQRDKSVSQNKEERSQSRVRLARENAAKLHIRSASGRSKSVDPGISETKSPKRKPHSPVPPASSKAAKTSSEARPRPTTLSTSASSRLKTSSSSSKSKDDLKDKNSASSTTKSVGQPVKKKSDASKKVAEVDKKEEEEQPAPAFDNEPIVKSPPEPTRVKSPEQMMMRSPEPVNWTVPLDTGKIFTVTQNVQASPIHMKPKGDAVSRLQGEAIQSSIPQVGSPPGNSLSLESLEVCKIMDLSFTSEDLEKHFEPVQVSSPLRKDFSKVAMKESSNNQHQTIDSTENTVINVQKESDLSSSPKNTVIQSLSDFEQFNNVQVEFNEQNKSISETSESNETKDEHNNQSKPESPTDQISFANVNLTEKTMPIDSSEASSVESNLTETNLVENIHESDEGSGEIKGQDISEFENIQMNGVMEDDNSDQSKNEGLASISVETFSGRDISSDKAVYELNDAHTSYNDDHSDFLNESNYFGDRVDHGHLHHDSNESNKIIESSERDSHNEEVEFSLNSDIINRYDNIEHESIFTKEDLLSEKNSSSMDDSELNYPASLGNASKATAFPSMVDSKLSPEPEDETDKKDTESIDSVIENDKYVEKLSKDISAGKENEASEIIVKDSMENLESALPESITDSVKEDTIDDLPAMVENKESNEDSKVTSSTVNAEMPSTPMSDKINPFSESETNSEYGLNTEDLKFGEFHHPSADTSSHFILTKDQFHNDYENEDYSLISDVSGVKHVNANSVDLTSQVDSTDHLIEEGFKQNPGIENDDYDERYAVVSVTDFEENHVQSLKNEKDFIDQGREDMIDAMSGNDQASDSESVVNMKNSEDRGIEIEKIEDQKYFDPVTLESKEIEISQMEDYKTEVEQSAAAVKSNAALSEMDHESEILSSGKEIPGDNNSEVNSDEKSALKPTISCDNIDSSGVEPLKKNGSIDNLEMESRVSHAENIFTANHDLSIGSDKNDEKTLNVGANPLDNVDETNLESNVFDPSRPLTSVLLGENEAQDKLSNSNYFSDSSVLSNEGSLSKNIPVSSHNEEGGTTYKSKTEAGIDFAKISESAQESGYESNEILEKTTFESLALEKADNRSMKTDAPNGLDESKIHVDSDQLHVFHGGGLNNPNADSVQNFFNNFTSMQPAVHLSENEDNNEKHESRVNPFFSTGMASKIDSHDSVLETHLEKMPQPHPFAVTDYSLSVKISNHTILNHNSGPESIMPFETHDNHFVRKDETHF